MSTIGISSDLLSQIAGSPSTANQFVNDVNQLAHDLQSGNLAAAQQDYLTLSQDALNGATSSTATSSASGITAGLLTDITSSPGSLTAFVDQVDQLGNDLQNGDLASAQSDMLGLDSTALNAASAAGAATSASPAAASSATAPGTANNSALIQAIVEAMGAGDSSVVSSGLTELASVSSSSAGAGILSQMAANYGGGASATAATGSTEQLLQSLNTSGTSDSNSILSMIA